MIATLCAPAFATEKAQDTGDVVLVVEGRDMQIYSEPAGEVIDSQSVGSVSISNTAVADSGSVIENYSNYVWAEANASTSKTVKSAIATFSAYQPGYNTFTCSLKAAVP